MEIEQPKARKNKEKKKPKVVMGVYGNEKGTVEQYFKYYSKIMNQQNMMMDDVRTSCYYDAIFRNKYSHYIERTSKIKWSWMSELAPES